MLKKNDLNETNHSGRSERIYFIVYLNKFFQSVLNGLHEKPKLNA